MVEDENFEELERDIKAYESVEDLKYPQEIDSNSPIVPIFYLLKEKELKDPRVQAKIRRSRLSNIYIFVFCPENYALPKKTIRANGNIYQTFKPKNYRVLESSYQDKSSMGLTIIELNLISSTC